MSQETLHQEVESSTTAVEKAIDLLISTYLDQIPEAKKHRFKLGVNELVRNAFEHGNLGITSEMKNESLEAGGFEGLVKAKSKEAQVAGKKLKIESSVQGKRFTCRISDQGNGFDWRGMIEFTDVTELHGRGVFIAKRSFDDVVYNEAGNEVTAIMLLVED